MDRNDLGRGTLDDDISLQRGRFDLLACKRSMLFRVIGVNDCGNVGPPRLGQMLIQVNGPLQAAGVLAGEVR